jgi:hypothetical protein
VVRTGRPANGIRPKLTPYTDPKPLDWSKPNSTQFITFGATHHMPKNHQPIKWAPPTKSQYRRFVLVFSFFSCCSFLVTGAPRPAKAAQPILTICTPNDAVSRKEVPFVGPNAWKNFQWVNFLKINPKFKPVIGISSLNKTMNDFSTVHAIFAQICSIGTARRNKF